MTRSLKMVDEDKRENLANARKKLKKFRQLQQDGISSHDVPVVNGYNSSL
ncbi:unnamed protein product, partial [Didymodactylos carnosus]